MPMFLFINSILILLAAFAMIHFWYAAGRSRRLFSLALFLGMNIIQGLFWIYLLLGKGLEVIYLIAASLELIMMIVITSWVVLNLRKGKT